MTRANLLRLFLKKVDWTSITPVCYLWDGEKTPSNYNNAKKTLWNMSRKETPTGRKPLHKPLKILKTRTYQTSGYATPETKKKIVGEALYWHNVRLRECVAKWLHDRDYQGITDLNFKCVGSSYPDMACGSSRYFELDNGNMSINRLVEKLTQNYSHKGAYQVIIWMHPRMDEIEESRVAKLAQIIKNTPQLRSKPNRYLIAGYNEYLKNGILRNYREILNA